MHIASTAIYALTGNQRVALGWLTQCLSTGTILQTFMNQSLDQVFARVTYPKVKGPSKLLGPFAFGLQTNPVPENPHIGDLDQ
jgi:hypothetical protein